MKTEHYAMRLGGAPPATMTKEWQEASNEKALEEKQNPITGLCWYYAYTALLFILCHDRYFFRGIQGHWPCNLQMIMEVLDMVCAYCGCQYLEGVRWVVKTIPILRVPLWPINQPTTASPLL